MQANLAGPSVELIASGSRLAGANEQSRSLGAASKDSNEVKKRFKQFVAGNFYRSMLEAMRKANKQEKPLIHGGRAEEIFRAQLDQTLAERFADTHGEAMTGKMFDHFLRQRNVQPVTSRDSKDFATHDERTTPAFPVGTERRLDGIV